MLSNVFFSLSPPFITSWEYLACLYDTLSLYRSSSSSSLFLSAIGLTSIRLLRSAILCLHHVNWLALLFLPKANAFCRLSLERAEDEDEAQSEKKHSHSRVMSTVQHILARGREGEIFRHLYLYAHTFNLIIFYIGEWRFRTHLTSTPVLRLRNFAPMEMIRR